ncbi:DUF3649 domain-containing protein [Lampropedia aestuarii]|uniref:DUF3649 domain-containing protein n=1 Tax=Lampropedia aestuarii TaxID=2562762 RepID=UPI002469169D|nr:DUF3649 domain-containing protein [Lampropedia aestuarii]MDH5855749.1 DUF3649 domain-containing protein [Lampropedia aestuarii]
MAVEACPPLHAGRAWLSRYGPLLSRVVAAVLGGYGLAMLTTLAALALPTSRSEAALAGLLAGFLVYAAAIIWVFAVRSAMRAWLGLCVAAAVLLPFAWVAR